MSRNRNQLHRTKLDQFKQYCRQQGWSEVEPKGDYEILRMTKFQEPTLIVYDRSRGDHLTIYGVSLKLFKQWQRSKGFQAHQQEELFKS